MTDRPLNILEYAHLVHAREPGIRPPSEAWEATLRLLYGLKMPEELIPVACQITQREADDIRSLEGHAYREAWASVGRRGEKTDKGSLIGGFELQFGGHERYLMPGERGYVVVISKDLAGTQVVVSHACAYFDALGVRYTKTRQGAMQVLEVEGSRMAIACTPANGIAVRGYPVAVAICDEIAFWPSSSEMAHPDTEVLAALRPAMLQFPNRKLIAISSANAKQGAHYDTIHGDGIDSKGALGNASEREILAVKGPTWTFNPSVSREETHKLERSKRLWAREYLSEPQDAVCAALDPDDVEATFREVPRGTRSCPPMVIIDASSLRGDSFTWCLARWLLPGERLVKMEVNENGVEQAVIRDNQFVHEDPLPAPTLHVTGIGGHDGHQLGKLTSEQIVRELVAFAKAAGALHIYGDQREEAALSGLFRHAGFYGFRSIAWTQQNKADAMHLLRRLLHERALIVQPHAQMKQQMLGLEERILPSGQFSYGARRGAHDDYAALLITAMLADASWGLPGSPHRIEVTRSARMAS